MAKHGAGSFSESLFSGKVEPFPMEKRIGRTASWRPMEPRADKFVVIAVLAFVVGFLTVFAVAATRNAPEAAAKDASLMMMYGP